MKIINVVLVLGLAGSAVFGIKQSMATKDLLEANRKLLASDQELKQADAELKDACWKVSAQNDSLKGVHTQGIPERYIASTASTANPPTSFTTWQPPQHAVNGTGTSGWMTFYSDGKEEVAGYTPGCDSSNAASNGGWKRMASAPRDGTTVEMLETYGVAPWYGIFRWTKDGQV